MIWLFTDSLKALELYEKIFDIKRVEVSNFPKGENEVIFTLYEYATCWMKTQRLDCKHQILITQYNLVQLSDYSINQCYI